MAFDNLSDKLAGVFKRLRSKGKLSEADVKEAMREVRLALLEADVNYKVAKDFTNSVTEKCIGEKVMESLTAPQMVVKIVREELTALMGSEHARLKTSSKIPTVIMMCGLQGSGKTTHSAKLAKYLKKQGHRPLLVACDIYRPAAIEQLKVVGKAVDTPVFEMGTEKPEKISEMAVRHARDYGYDYVILDTAGPHLRRYGYACYGCGRYGRCSCYGRRCILHSYAQNAQSKFNRQASSLCFG